MRTSESTKALNDALVAFAEEVRNVSKTGTADIATKGGARFSYGYAELDAILAYTRPLLAKRGLAVSQDPGSDADGRPTVSTRLSHVSGEWLETSPLAMPTAGDAQAVGSAITYARRYQILAVLGIAAGDDDDGKAATASPSEQRREGPVSTSEGEQWEPGEGEGSGGASSSPPAPTFEQLVALAGTAQKAVAAINQVVGARYKVADARANSTERERAAAAEFIRETVKAGL